MLIVVARMLKRIAAARNHIQGIKNLKLFLSLFTLYYQASRAGR
jgi:hypothetical protein